MKDDQTVKEHGPGLKLGEGVKLEYQHTLEGHAGAIYSACMSADGRFGLSGGADSSLRLWDIASGKCLRTLPGHRQAVMSVCMRPDGLFGLSGSFDNTIKLWNLQTGECLNTWIGHTGAVRSICMSADGKFAVSGSEDQTFRIWRFLTGRCLCVCKEPDAWVLSVNADAKRYVLSSGGNVLRLTDIKTRKYLRTFEGHTQTVTSVCLSADGRFALSGSEDRTLRLWDTATGDCLRVFEGHSDVVQSACISRDGRYALSASDDKTLRLWDTATGRCLCVSDAGDNEVFSICMSADGKYVLTAGMNRSNAAFADLRLWTLTAVEGVGMAENKTLPGVTIAGGYAGDTAIAGGVTAGVTAEGCSFADEQTAADRTAANGQVAPAEGKRINGDWEAGDVVSDTYKVLGLLGEGGMAKVFKVYHKGWNAELAMKCARPELFESQSGKEAFVHEAEAWANLGPHPNIAYCYYVKSIGAIPHVFAEFIEGGSLAKWIEDGALYEGGKTQAFARILDVAIQSAWGLHYAHEQGLIHQDVKPANILMTKQGQPKITDFGLVGARGAAGMMPEQRDGTVNATWGGMTPAYCSPEQANIAYLGESGAPREEWPRLTRRTDIWSWAATVLEMLLGERNWMVGQAAGYALREYESMKESLPGCVPEMPKPVWELLSSCLAEDETQRPATMAEAADTLVKIFERETGVAYPREMPKATKLRAAALNNRAVSLYDLGKRDEAEELWKSALEDEQHHPESAYNLGLAEWRTLRITDDILVQRLEENIRLHPSDWIPQYLLAQAHTERSDFDSASAILEKLLSEYPENGEIVAALEQARSNAGKTLKCLRTFKEHTKGVISVCMGADGRCALSGGWDNTLMLWDMAAGECLRKLDGYKACISADGRYTLFAGNDHTLRLWDISAGECLRTFEGHTAWIHSICMSADGRHALSGSKDDTLRLWDLATGKCLRVFEGHTERTVCMSGDGRFALSGNKYSDKTPRLWDLLTGDCLRTFEGHTAWVHSVCMSADGRYALSGSEDNTLRLWDLSTGRCLRIFEGHTDCILSVCISANGRYALAGGYDSMLRLWDTATGKCLHTFGKLDGWVLSVCMSADGRYALSGGYDNRHMLWGIDGNFNIAAPLMLSRLPGVEKIISEQSEQEKYLMEASQNEKVGDVLGKYKALQKIRLESGNSIPAEFMSRWAELYSRLPKKAFLGVWSTEIFKGHTNSVYSVCMDAGSRYALTGGWDSTLKLWDIASGKCARSFQADSHFIKAVCMSADGRFALSNGGERDTALWLWDVSTGECLKTLEGHEGMVKSICMSADSRYAVSGSSDKTVKVWDIAAGRCLHTIEAPVKSVCVSADSRYALFASDFGIKLLDMMTGDLPRAFDPLTNWINSVCISADGRYALSGGNDRTLRLWDIATGQCVYTFEGHTSGVASVHMSADGRYALSGSYDKTLKMWDIASGQCLHTFEGHTGEITSVFMSADGRYVLSSSIDGTFRLWALYWELEPKEPIDWDEGASPYLVNFLTLHTPYAGGIPADREPSEAEIRMSLTRKGSPSWTEEDFQKLLYHLGCAGYGWLRPEGVRTKLMEMAAKMKDGVKEMTNFIAKG